MATSPEPRKLRQLLERASTDPALMERLGKDPLGTAQAEGVDISPGHLKHLLGMPNASDGELIDVLRARMSHAATSCGGSA